MARVIISSGHTSDNPGVVAFGLREYDLARKIAKFALKYIRQAGIISLSTPPNLDLAQRITWINNTGYNAGSNDVAIEIHINDGGKRGIEGWFEQDGNNPSEKLTTQIVNAICQDLTLPSQGIKSEFQHEMGSISFIHEVASIGCVVECCYIDNQEDSAILANDFALEKMGRSIAKGIIAYFGLNIELPDVIQTTPQQIAQTQVRPQAIPQTQPYVQAPTQSMNYNQPTYSQPVNSYQPTVYPQSSVNQPVSYQQPISYPQIPVQTQQQIQPTQQAQPVYPQRPIAMTPDQQLQQYQNYQAPTSPTYPNPRPTAAMPQVQPQSNGANSANKQGFLPREERKEMIIKSYAKILGRDPNENDLNFFLNTGIREDELLKKMIDSQEHADLVKARQEVITAKMKLSDEQNELMTLRSKAVESDTIIKGLNDTLIEKNKAIFEQNKRIKELELQKDTVKGSIKKSSSAEQKTKYKGNFSDRVFKAFSDILE